MQREMRVGLLGYHGFTNSVLHEVVVEISTRSQTKNQIGDFWLRVFSYEPDIAQSVIPVIATKVFLELERVT